MNGSNFDPNVQILIIWHVFFCFCCESVRLDIVITTSFDELIDLREKFFPGPSDLSLAVEEPEGEEAQSKNNHYKWNSNSGFLNTMQERRKIWESRFRCL
jgi:hypothetical protein